MIRAAVGILSYNEAKSIPAIVGRLMETVGALPDVEFVPVVINNGSTDDTKAVIETLKQQYPTLKSLDIAVNKGYGFGVRSALASLDADVMGYMWGDNQFDAKIVSDIIQMFVQNPSYQFIKTFRAKRYDGAWRLVISRIYQILFRLLYGTAVRDINAGPKILRRELLKSISPLVSNDWFIDAEIMIKTTKLMKKGALIEIPMTFFPRKFGKSNVKFSTCFEFVYNLVVYRFTKFNA